jgi:hypothetical protein
MATIKELTGPCYGVSHQHQFTEIEQRITSLKQLAGPVYEIESDHHFTEIADRVNNLKNLRKEITAQSLYSKEYCTYLLKKLEPFRYVLIFKPKKIFCRHFEIFKNSFYRTYETNCLKGVYNLCVRKLYLISQFLVLSSAKILKN